ncbi:MAG TPA: tetratricopeptide repeat protein [Malonomonas sp.]
MTETNQQSSLLGKIAAYTEIWAKDPSSTIFVSLGEAYRKMGMLDDARDVVERGLVRNPDFSPAHIVLARILCQQGDYSGSEASFQRALDSDQGSLAALVGYARLSILLGHENRARKLLLAARNISPADSIINKLLLSLPEQLDPEPEVTPGVEEELYAEESAEPVEPQAKEIPLASVTLAELYLKQGLESEALEMYRRLSAQKPNDLMLRRQIKSLEERCAGSTKTNPDDSSVAFPVQPSSLEKATDNDSAHEVVVPAPLEVTMPVSAEISEQFTGRPVDEIFGAEKVLDTLQQWLVTIRQRRGDV